jgi:hypothetical protein
MTPRNDLKAIGRGIFELLSPNLPKGSQVNLEKKFRISDVSAETRRERLPIVSLQDYRNIYQRIGQDLQH